MRLADFLMSSAPTPQILSLVHCTTVGSWFDTIETGELKTTHCPVYNDDLLYMFYGRPAYKPAENMLPSSIIDIAPVCLILSPTLLDAAIRAVPFDSGGFQRYHDLVGPNFNRTDFELSGDPSLALRLVSAFYQSNRNYYDQAPVTREADLPVSRRTARAFARLIADPALRNVDDRCGTIELQYDSSVRLADALQAIIAPSSVLDDPEVTRALSACNHAVPIPYNVYGRFAPAGFTNSILERVDNFLATKGAFV